MNQTPGHLTKKHLKVFVFEGYLAEPNAMKPNKKQPPANPKKQHAHKRAHAHIRTHAHRHAHTHTAMTPPPK